MIRILSLAIAVELAVLFGAAVALAWRRRRNITGSRRLDEARERAARWLADALSGLGTPPSELAGALGSLPAEDARRALVQVGEQVDLEGRRVLKTVYDAAGLAASSARDLSGSPIARLVLAREARALDDPARILVRLVDDPDAEVRLSAVESLAELGRAAECVGAIDSLSGVGPRTRARLIDAFAASATHPTQALAALLEKGGPETQQVALAVLGFAQDLSAAPKIEACLKSEDLEVRLQALRALRAIGDPGSFARVRPLLADPRWEVRVEAVRASAALAREGASADLGPLLDDEADWVRHHAAMELVALGDRGAELVRAAAEKGIAAARSALALHALELEVRG